ncbi:helix-turn-helix domain-containing protein [Candidatus Poriferisodalis sp.]|uniref:TetR/AcrR family transcriptional regulator n=1 Tax=Candidatus Poriferisodalis sp. TaxID=3101277 RepID=UPI003AF949B4
MIENRAADAGESRDSIDVIAEVAAVYALQRGWWVFRDVFEVSLEEFGLDRRAMRLELAERSMRIVDRSLPAVVNVAELPPARNEPPPAAAPQGRGPEAVQARLLDAVRDLLADRSPADVTAKEIVASAGVNHGQIHHYFGSKEALAASTIRREAGRFVLVGMDGGQRFPVLADPEVRPPLWRTLGHLAMTGAWPGSDPSSSPVITEMVRVLSRTLDRSPGDPVVHAQVAAVHSLRLGWGSSGTLPSTDLAKPSPALQRPMLRRLISPQCARAWRGCQPA